MLKYEVGHFKEVHIMFSCYACQFQIHFQLSSRTQTQVYLDINFYVFHLTSSATEHLCFVFYVAESTKINKPKGSYLAKEHFCTKRRSNGEQRDTDPHMHLKKILYCRNHPPLIPLISTRPNQN